jgi:hypothetical protein
VAIADTAPGGESRSGVQDPHTTEPKKSDRGHVEVGGRLFVRGTLSKVSTGVAPWVEDFEISSARLQVDYRRKKHLKVSIEAELSDEEVELRDVYMRLRPVPELRVVLGKFKRPLSPIALESAWRLPQVERGVLHEDVETAKNRFPLRIGRRSEGAMIDWRPEVALEPELVVAVMRSELARPNDPLDPDLYDKDEVDLFRDVFVRGQIEPVKDITVGGTVGYVKRVKAMNDVDQVALGSLDATYDGHNVRVWVEGFISRTPYIGDFDTRARGMMVAGRGLLAVRFRRPVSWLRRVEPFLGAGSLELSTQIDRTRVNQISTGVSLEGAKDWRVQLEYARTSDYALSAAVSYFYAQLGAAF